GEWMRHGRDVRQQRNCATNEERRECAGRGIERRTRMRRNAIFIGKHRSNPKLAIGRYGADNALQVVALQTFCSKDLSNFLALSVRELIDVAFLTPAQSLEFLP